MIRNQKTYDKELQRIQSDNRYTPAIKSWMISELNKLYAIVPGIKKHGEASRSSS